MNADKKYIRLSCRIAAALAVVACAFSLVVALLMVLSLTAVRESSPLNMTVIDQLRASLKENPADETIKTKIRDLDLISRRMYFSGVTSLRTGSFVLLGGIVVALISLKCLAVLRKKRPDPREYSVGPGALEAAVTARWVIAGITVALLTCAGVVGVLERRGSVGAPGSGAPVGLKEDIVAVVAPAGPALPPTEFLTNWPAFRGPTGCGTAPYTNLPVAWDVKSGKGIVWKVTIPLPGMSSPIVWGNRVFVTGATEVKRELYCYETAKGVLLWKTDFDVQAGGSTNIPKIFQDTGYAAPTSLTDGRLVYSIFANGDVAAVDLCANKMWITSLGLPDNKYGYSCSPLLHDGKLLVQFDHGAEGGKTSQLIALDTVTGKKLWGIPRPVTESWPSPLLIDTGKGLQLVTMANEFIISHDPANGREIWRVKCGGSDVAPSPIYAGGLVIATVTSESIYAIRPDGQGDVTATHVAWKSEDGVSDVASPVSNGDVVFFAHSGGTVTCLDVQTGKIVWDKSLEAEFYASPVIAGGNVYLVARNGDVFIFKAGRKYEDSGKASLGEPSDCSPALVSGRIFMRGATNLFCIGN